MAQQLLLGGRDKTKLLVAAIDFGTTYSGWAFSFNHEYKSDPSKVSCKHWFGGQHVSLKAPTTVLIKPDGKTLEAFGYEAEDKYAELAFDGKHTRHYYFKRFKMMLYDKIGLNRNIEIEDDKGKPLPAKTVFSLAISYLRQDLLDTCTKRLATDSIDETDIHWVITVPAIWNDAAKQFMRESAVQGGIANEHLTIALEPEAASMFCRLLPVEKMVGQTGMSLAGFKPGAKYLVFDAGGGTVDITVHQVMDGGKLGELHKASGGAWGGTQIDEAFIQLLIKLIGNPILRKFQREHTDDYLDMMREFEVKKRDIRPDKDGKITVRLPTALKELFQKITSEDLKTTIAQTNYANQITLAGDKMRIDASVMKKLFTNATNNMVSHLKTLIKDPKVRGTESILMVGGFSESPMVQEAIRSNFPNMRLIIPEEAGLVVLKGAVVFGHCPSSVAERVCRYTYGVRTSHVFEECTHDPSKKFTNENGELRCHDIFSKHVQMGQTVEFGVAQTQQYYHPTGDNQTEVGFTLYASTDNNPMYVTDPGVRKLCDMTVPITDMSVPRTDRGFYVHLTFSGTEIEVTAKEKTTGDISTVTADFLG